MKNRMIIALCVCLAVSVTACSQRNNEKEPEASQSQSVSENPSIPSEQEEPNSPAFVEDDAFYQNILITYGGVMQMDEHNKPYLSSTKMGLFFVSDWQTPKDIPVGGYFIWYLTMANKEDISFEEKQEKYKSPFGPDTGWFYPQDLFEPLVQQYFDVSTEYLRSDSTIYNVEHEGYYIDGGGGIGDTPVIVLNRVESDGDLRKLYVRLNYKYQDVESKVLTVKLAPDGDYKFESYVAASQKPSQSESTPSESDSFSMADEAQSNININSSVSEPTESQRSHSSSIEPDTTTVYIELSNNTIMLEQINNSFQVPFKIYNNSSKEIYLGPSYKIEKHNGAEWISFPFNELEQPNWPSVVFSIPADSTIDANLSYWAFEEEMTLGTYRLVKQVGEERKEWLTIYAKFSVVE